MENCEICEHNGKQVPASHMYFPKRLWHRGLRSVYVCRTHAEMAREQWSGKLQSLTGCVGLAPSS